MSTLVVYSCRPAAAAVMSLLPPPASVALMLAFRYTSSLICKWCGTRAFRWRNTRIPASWLTLWSWCRNRCLFVRVYAFVSGSFIDWIRQCDTTERSCRLCNDWCIAGTPCHQPDGDESCATQFLWRVKLLTQAVWADCCCRRAVRGCCQQLSSDSERGHVLERALEVCIAWVLGYFLVSEAGAVDHCCQSAIGLLTC